MKKRESGQVVVEASIVVTLVFMVISTMLYIGMAMYQQTAISVIANRTATNIAQVYSNNLKDPFTGYYDPESAYQSVTYGNMKTDAYIDSLEQKGIAFAEYRLKKAQIISAIDRDVEVNVVQKPGEVLKAQIVVTIEDSYNVPLMRLFGVNGDISFSGTGRADCVDLLEYFNGIEAVADPENSPIPSLPDSDTCVITFVRDRKSSEFHEAVPVLRGKSIITSNRYSHSVMPKDPTLGDLRFLGWYTEEGRRFGATHTVERNMTVYGRWECRIDLDACGGTVEPSFVAAEYGQPTILPTPVRYSFAFEGWYTERDGAGERFVSGVAEITSDITLYAKWRCIHSEFDYYYIQQANCLQRDVWRRECKYCDFVDEVSGNYGGCTPSAEQVSVSPSCTTTGWYVITCTVCSRTLESGSKDALGHNYAANGIDYDETYSRSATCTRQGLVGSRCSRCHAEKGSATNALGHSYDARCGVTHNMENNRLYLSVHNRSDGYQTSTKVECLVCIRCGDPYGSWWRFWDDDGCRVAHGFICREHIDRYGRRRDSAFSYLPIVYVH